MSVAGRKGLGSAGLSDGKGLGAAGVRFAPGIVLPPDTPAVNANATIAFTLPAMLLALDGAYTTEAAIAATLSPIQIEIAVGTGINTAQLDGITDHMEKASAPTGVTDSANGTLSFGFTMEGGDSQLQTFLWVGTSSDYGLRVERLANNKIQAIGRTAAGVTIFTVVSTSTFIADSTKHHCRLQWNDTAATLTIDGADETNNTPGTSGSVDLTDKWSIARSDDSANRNYLNATLGEIWFDDISVTENEEFWNDTTGAFRFLGANGDNPLDQNPPLYLKSAHTNFGNNSGSGGDFTVVGALALGGDFGNYAAAFTPAVAVNATIAMTLPSVTLAAAVTALGLAADNVNGLALNAVSQSRINNDGITFDPPTGLLSYWFVRTSAGNNVLISNPENRFVLTYTTDNIVLNLRTNAGANLINANVAGSAFADGDKHHFLASWDTETSAIQVYIDDSARVPVSAAEGVSGGIDLNRAHYCIGADVSTGGGVNNGNFAEMDIAEFYFDTPATFFNLDVTANRLEFRTSAGGIVDLGVSGAGPTGLPPNIYIRASAGNFANSGESGAVSAVNPTNAAFDFGNYAA